MKYFDPTSPDSPRPNERGVFNVADDTEYPQRDFRADLYDDGVMLDPPSADALFISLENVDQLARWCDRTRERRWCAVQADGSLFIVGQLERGAAMYAETSEHPAIIQVELVPIPGTRREITS